MTRFTSGVLGAAVCFELRSGNYVLGFVLLQWTSTISLHVRAMHVSIEEAGAGTFPRSSADSVEVF